ncbi:hypothetical protein PRZ48_009134 [Zasmidium cellare]|uniref:ZN622/Rei1/Reh1 zinc finger C2H2-type domain-containing protein n=1 Tax=Zasmidium cellare TaxID=395010 RepID=A0ABR0EHE7_ZASCE|nr:hypothetical protein PRZ48_009134 [Zasmidium cellare]
MQRKVAELPPISLQSYQSLVGSRGLEKRVDRAPEQEASPSNSSLSIAENVKDEHPQYPIMSQESDSSDEDDELLSEPERCLFCTFLSSTVDDCLSHMQQSHGFHIPQRDALQTDLETLLAYLNLVISRFHSCLYCGHEKYSADGARSHMISKGHCMLDLSKDSDFLDFWTDEEADQQGEEDENNIIPPHKLSEVELRLPSGSVSSSRRDGRPSIRPARSKGQVAESTALVATSNNEPTEERPTPQPQSSSSRKSTAMVLSQRDQMGLIGLSDSQQRSLAITHKKLVAREQRFRNDARWTVEKFGNTTKMKHFKVSRSGIHSAIQVC